MTEFAPRSSPTGVPGHGLALMVSIVVVCGIGAFLFDAPSRPSEGLSHPDALERLDECNPQDAPEWTVPESGDRATDSSDDDGDDDDDGTDDAAITVAPLRVSDSGHVWRERPSAVIALISVAEDGHRLRGPPSAGMDAADAEVNDDDRSDAALTESSAQALHRHACLLAGGDINRSLPPASYGESLRAPPH